MEDPMYGVTPEAPRFDLYRIPGIPLSRQEDAASLKADSDVLLRNQYTRIHQSSAGPGRVFSTLDKPMEGMLLYKNEARPKKVISASMQFKTCLYRIQDIPTSGKPKFPGTPVDQGGPIYCLEWDNQQIYNPETEEFDHSDTIHPSCAR